MSESDSATTIQPVEERAADLLSRAGFDESDTSNALDALRPLFRDYERIEDQRDDAIGAIQDAALLIGSFDPTCGSGRSRTFVADLDRILRGREAK